MAKTRSQKVANLESITSQLNYKGIVLFTYTGMKVIDQEALRKQLRQAGVKLLVVKRNLLLKACQQVGLTVDPNQVHGALALATSVDEVTPAKVIADFRKKHEQVQFVGGILERAFITSEQVMAMSKLPSKTELLAQMVGSMNAPISGLVNVMAGNLRSLVNVLNAVHDSRSAS